MQGLGRLPSGYYEWKGRAPSERAGSNAQLAEQITYVFDDEQSRIGSLRITRRLRNEG